MADLYVVYRYGPLGVADVQYIKVRSHHRQEWTRNRDSASVFKLPRAQAIARGYRAARGEDLVIERK